MAQPSSTGTSDIMIPWTGETWALWLQLEPRDEVRLMLTDKVCYVYEGLVSFEFPDRFSEGVLSSESSEPAAASSAALRPLDSSMHRRALLCKLSVVFFFRGGICQSHDHEQKPGPGLF